MQGLIPVFCVKFLTSELVVLAQRPCFFTVETRGGKPLYTKLLGIILSEGTP